MENVTPALLKPYMPLIWKVFVAILIFVAGWLASKIVAKLVSRGLVRSKVDLALANFLANIARYTVLAATVIAALGAVGMQTTSLVAVFASAGLAVGLALQGSLSNFASGVMILFFRPFELGQFVTTAGSTGTVADIGIFHTTLITPNNEKLIIPNAKVTGDTIVNLTAEGTRRGAVEVGVAYGSDVARVQSVLLEAVKRTELVLADPAPAAPLTGLGASSIDFTILAWSEAADYLPMLHNVRCAAYEALAAANIEIPFPQMVLHKPAA